MDSYEEYERQCDEIRKQNAGLLDAFEEWLYKHDVKEKTVEKHARNVDFYINIFLLDDEAQEASDGVFCIGGYLGYWFIRNADWSSKTALKENAASLKKFYQFMLEKGEIAKEDLEFLSEQIKNNMPEWLATLERYHDPDIEDPEEIWFGDETEDTKLSTFAEWQKLFKVAIEFKQAKCWEWMDDYDIFGVQDPESGEIAYCCITGGAEEQYGIVAYLGSKGLDNILMIESGELQPDLPGSELEISCLLASFEDRDYLSQEDLGIIKDLGLKFRGKKQWPYFRNFTPGYFPWHLSAEDCRFLTHIIEQALVVSHRCRQDKGIIETSDPSTFLVRVPRKKGESLAWADKYLTAEQPQTAYFSFYLEDEFRLKKVLKYKAVKGGALEVDISYVLHPVQEKTGQRPYYPKLYLLVDKTSGMVLHHQLLHSIEEQGQGCIEALVAMVEKNKKMPSKIEVDNEETYYLFHDICEQLKIPIKKVNSLRVTNVIREQM